MSKDNKSLTCNLVPIVVTTLCRYEHFVRCIESLKNNSLAYQTDIYIGLDYPLKDEHWEGYTKISSYLSKLSGFKTVNIIKHNANLGSSGNYYSVLNEVYKKYDRYIFTEDDNEFSPSFLEYINMVMNEYENDESVIAVSGYNYPVNLFDLEGNVYSLNTYFSAYGYGTWRRKKEKCEKACNYEQFKTYFLNRGKMNELYHRSHNQFCNFVKGMIGYIPWMREGSEIKKLDLSYGLYMFFEDKKMIFPVISKVKNWGFDGSGEHCDVNIASAGKLSHRNYDFSTQIIDKNPFLSINMIEENQSAVIDARLNEFFNNPVREQLLSIIAYNLYSLRLKL